MIGPRTVLATIESISFPRLFAVFALLRVLGIIAIAFLTDLSIDEDYYDDIARSLNNGDGYRVAPGEAPDLLRTPAYTWLLALLFKIGSESYIFVCAVQILLDLATAWLVYKTARPVVGELSARFGVIFVLAYPLSAAYATRYLTETLFTLLVVAVAYFLGRALRERRICDFLLAGAVLGVGALCKPVLLYFAPLLPVLAFVPWRQPQRLKILASLAATAAIALLVVSPWMIRNARVAGQFVSLGTSGGFSIWLGNNLETDGRDWDELDEPGRQIFNDSLHSVIGDKGPHTFETSKLLSAAAKKSMLENPGPAIALIWKKCWRFWFDIYGRGSAGYSIVAIPIQAVALLLGVAGAILAWRRRLPIWHWVYLILMMNGLHALVTATMRYSISIMPFVLCLAAYFLATMLGPKRDLQS